MVPNQDEDTDADSKGHPGSYLIGDSEFMEPLFNCPINRFTGLGLVVGPSGAVWVVPRARGLTVPGISS